MNTDEDHGASTTSMRSVSPTLSQISAQEVLELMHETSQSLVEEQSKDGQCYGNSKDDHGRADVVEVDAVHALSR